MTHIKLCLLEIMLPKYHCSGFETRLLYKLTGWLWLSQCFASHLYYFSYHQPWQVSMVSKQTIHINFTGELHMRKLKEACNRLVSCLGWPCPSKWHIHIYNHKIASWSKRQLWPQILVIQLDSLYVYYCNLSHIGFAIQLYFLFLFIYSFYSCVCLFWGKEFL